MTKRFIHKFISAILLTMIISIETIIPVFAADSESKVIKAGQSVYYSTNTKDTVKNGNSGVYAYKRDGTNYDLYWIIDFDEGYAYQFYSADYQGICDRVKIITGDLNDRIIVRYQDGDDVWYYGLHFKWYHQPDHLIMQELNGTTYDYYTTDLDAALRLRDKKTIIDY